MASVHRHPLSAIPFCSKFLTLKLLTLFRFLIFLPLPSLYFLISSPSLLDFLFVLSFSAALLISLNLALQRLPSISLFLCLIVAYEAFFLFSLCEFFSACDVVDWVDHFSITKCAFVYPLFVFNFLWCGVSEQQRGTYLCN
jgi:hypothetical protein